MFGPTFVVKAVGMISCINIGMNLLIYIQEPSHLKTPITDPKKETVQSSWGNYTYTNTTFDIIRVDNA